MVEVSHGNFNKFCFDLIGSETKLDVVARTESDAVIRCVYCEVPVLSKLRKTYPDVNKLYKYIAKNINDPCFYVCEYNKRNKVLTINKSKYTDIVFV